MFYGDIKELIKQNKNRKYCVRCGKSTKPCFNIERYCPDCEFQMSGEEEYWAKKKRLKKEAEQNKKKERELPVIGSEEDREEVTQKTNTTDTNES